MYRIHHKVKIAFLSDSDDQSVNEAFLEKKCYLYTFVIFLYLKLFMLREAISNWPKKSSLHKSNLEFYTSMGQCIMACK